MRPINHQNGAEGVGSDWHVNRMRDLVDSSLAWIEVGYDRRWRLTAAGRIAGIASRAVEYADEVVVKIGNVNAMVDIIDYDAVAAR